MKVLLIGGTGTLSSDTTMLCLKNGFEVYLFNRGTKGEMGGYGNLQYIHGNINDKTNAKELLAHQHFDVVIDYLTYNADTLKMRIDCFSGVTDQFIFISSATVYPISLSPINELSRIGNNGWSYAQNKYACEQYLMREKEHLNFNYTIVRPYVTYGINRIPFPIISKRNNYNLLYRIRNGLPFLMCGDGNQIMTLTHTKDFASGIVGLFCNPIALNNDFNVVGDVTSSWNEVIRIIETTIGIKAKPVYVPVDKIANDLPNIRDELLYDKGFSHVFDNSKLKHAVPSFESKISIGNGISTTVNHLIAHSSDNSIDKEWNAMENYLCAKYDSAYSTTISDSVNYYLYNSKLAFEIKSLKHTVFR